MSEASQARDQQRRARPVKFFLAMMTPTPDGKSAVTFQSDMTSRELENIRVATASYIDQKLSAEVERIDAERMKGQSERKLASFGVPPPEMKIVK